MPLMVSMPLPGPFRYTARLGGPGKGFTYWVFIGWWVLLLKWMIIGLYYTYKWVFIWLYRFCRFCVVGTVQCIRGGIEYWRDPR